LLSFLALCVALAGTSYAVASLPKNSVGTQQLRKGAVTTVKLHKRAVTTTQLSNGAVTTSKLSPDAAARIAGLTVVKFTFTVDPMTWGVASVPAPAGLTAISGGIEAPHTLNSAVMDTHPTPTGWEATVMNASDLGETLNLYAICAKAEMAAQPAAASSHGRFMPRGVAPAR